MHFFNDRLRRAPLNTCSCGACGSSALYLAVKASSQGPFATEVDCDLSFYRCEECQSLNELSRDQQHFYPEETDASFSNYYTDVIAGIEEMLEPVSRWRLAYAEKKGFLRFLELGSGYGYVVDYAQKVLGWASIGIEPCGYGRLGSKMLGIDIDKKLLGQGSIADDKEYDLIYASEVVEHLAEPLDLLQLVHGRLANEGSLLLTTPNAEYVSQDNPVEDVYSSLFPGEHKVLLSRRGAEILCRRAGFASVMVESRRKSNLVIQASKAKSLYPLYDNKSYINASRSEYLRYLDAAIKSPSGQLLHDPGANRVRASLLFRLIKDLTNSGDTKQAISLVCDHLERLCSLANSDLDAAAWPETILDSDSDRLGFMLMICLSALNRERALVQFGHQRIPTRGVAFMKTLGFYLCTLVHSIDAVESRKLLHATVVYLESLVDYAMVLRETERPDYHLEFVSLVGPALSSMVLARKKLGLSSGIDKYTFITEDWFQQSYPQSCVDLTILLANYEAKLCPHPKSLAIKLYVKYAAIRKKIIERAIKKSAKFFGAGFARK